MARKAPGKGKNRVAATQPPPSTKPASRAALATLEQVQDQDRERTQAMVGGLRRALKTLDRETGEDYAKTTLLLDEMTRRNAESFKDCYARLTALESRIDNADARAAEAIARCEKAAEVLRRVELGLRPMLVKALEAEQEIRGRLYTEAYDEAYNLYLHTSSLRS